MDTTQTITHRTFLAGLNTGSSSAEFEHSMEELKELAKALDLEVIDYFDDNTKIGRVCKADEKFTELKSNILMKFKNARIVNDTDDERTIRNVGIISGFGLKNPDYIKLAKAKNLDVLISGDLTHETAILAKNLKITLIDLTHHESEVSGLYALENIIKELDINTEVIDKNPIEVIK